MALSSVASPNLVEVDTAVTSKWCTIQSEVIKFSYVWTFENFSFFCEGTGQFTNSAEFTTGDNDEFKWYLGLYPRGYEPTFKEYLSIFLFLKSVPGDKPKVVCKTKFSILNAKREKTNIQHEKEATQLLANGNIFFLRFVRRDFLFNEANCLLPNDILTILCEVSFVADRATISGQDNSVQFKTTTPECKLSEDFNNLVLNESFSDVILELGGREIKTHKQILSAQSDVFAAMFKHNSEEYKLERVAVEDIDEEILKEMLRFMYTGRVFDLDKNAKALLAVADKYKLNKSRVMCEKVLLDNLSVETAAYTLIASAYLDSSDELKEEAIHFIKSNIEDVMNTKGWQKIITTSDYSKLLAEIITRPARICLCDDGV